jgi:hypothetical protein
VTEADRNATIVLVLVAHNISPFSEIVTLPNQGINPSLARKLNLSDVSFGIPG